MAVVVENANWVLSSQLADGAIAVWPDKPALRSISPYFSNYAAIGLSDATEVTGDTKYVDAAWSWLDWYATHEDAKTGYVTDYQIVNGTDPVSDGKFDSTDAYAGTFLTAAWDAFAITRSDSRLRRLSTAIAGAFKAMTSTQEGDGLTWAKPSYHMKYLMDNAEVYGGLIATGRLERALGDSALAAAADADARRLRSGVATLWDPSRHNYDWARSSNGVDLQVRWSVMYPDAMEETWAVAYGLVPRVRAGRIMSAFARNEPMWSQPGAQANFITASSVLPSQVGYWPLAALGLTTTRRSPTRSSAVASIQAAAASTNDAWPFTTADAGQMILAESGLPIVAP